MKKREPCPEIREKIFTFCRNIKTLREKHGLSTEQMAEIIGISEKKLILAENCADTGYFYDVHIKNICTYFNVISDELFLSNFFS